MNETQKKKLMVVVGAGASIELGMPSVNEIDSLFSDWAKERYQLINDEDKTLYCYIKDEVNHYYKLNPKQNLQKETNFEEVLYVIIQLSAALGDDNYKFPINAFYSEMKELPKINSHAGEKFVDGNDLRQLYFLLVDKLTSKFRELCKTSKENNKQNFNHFKNFINQLNNDYDVAFITLNYDNLINQAIPNLFTGFKKDGSFDPESIYKRSDWGLIYHLHGSVHFDMQGDSSDMHAIKWNENLNSTFYGNSSGRNSQDTSEGISMPTSAIIAGYGKTNQIQRVPFRTYYSKIDEIASMAEAFLFMGYGFNDLHLNNSLHTIRDGDQNKPIVIIDWAADDQDPMQSRHDDWTYNLCKAIQVDASKMATKKYKKISPNIKDLKKDKEFEVSQNPNYPLSIWYGGFIEACKNYSKIKSEL